MLTVPAARPSATASAYPLQINLNILTSRTLGLPLSFAEEKAHSTGQANSHTKITVLRASLYPDGDLLESKGFCPIHCGPRCLTEDLYLIKA